MAEPKMRARQYWNSQPDKRAAVRAVWPELAMLLDNPAPNYVNLGDLWHGDNGLDDIRRRQAVRSAWAELAYAIDYFEQPSWDMADDDQPAGPPPPPLPNRRDGVAEGLRQSAAGETHYVGSFAPKVTVRWDSVFTVALGFLIGIAVGAAIDFAIVHWLVQR